jgi:transcriptional regulator with XRE-family HTH domain
MPHRRNDANEKRLAEVVTRLRQSRNISQAELARASGYSRAYICSIEAGDVHNPSAQAAVMIARALGVPAMELLEASGDVEPGYRQSDIETEADLRLYLQRRGIDEDGITLIVRLLELLELSGNERSS